MISLGKLTEEVEKIIKKQSDERISFLEGHLRGDIIRECQSKGLYFRSGNGDWCCFDVNDGSVGEFSPRLTELLNTVFDSDPYNNIGSLLADYGHLKKR